MIKIEVLNSSIYYEFNNNIHNGLWDNSNDDIHNVYRRLQY